MAEVDSFRFGSIVIDGKKYARDVLVFPDGTMRQRKGGLWKFGSHAIKREEIEQLVKAAPEQIIVGTGTSAKARLTPDTESWANEAKLNLAILASQEAVERFNRLVQEGKRVAALIHITC